MAEQWDASLCDNANVLDQDAIESYPPRLLGRWQANCRDGVAGLAVPGRYQPNAFDLVDMLGNAREWVQDCQTTSRTGAPLGCFRLMERAFCRPPACSIGELSFC